MTEQEIDQLAKVLWDYNNLEQPLKKADLIFVLGSNDLRVAEHAVELFELGYASRIVFSGKSGKLTEKVWSKSEAEVFAEHAIKLGVPKEAILIEDQATNTGENIQFTKKLLEEKGINAQTIIAVQKPYMARRTYATFMKQWPGQTFFVTSPHISYDQYFTDELPKELVITILVGDTQRMKEYPNKGFQIPQEIPKEVWDAYEKLVAAGYTGHLIKD